jgi:hypothetical protein
MNLDTVLMCARIAANSQRTGLGYVDADVQALLDELTPAPVVEVVEEAPVVEEVVAPKTKRAKASAEVVEEPAAE